MDEQSLPTSAETGAASGFTQPEGLPPQPEAAAAATTEGKPAEEEFQGPSVRLKEDGGLEFDKGFLGDLEKDRPEPPSQEPASPEQDETPPPAFYTPEELGSTPWENVDLARLPEAARPYFPLVRNIAQENAALRAQVQAMQAAQARTPQAGQQPQGMDFMALSAAARQKAREKLGLGAGDNLDLYEEDNSAAFMAAMGELMMEQWGQQQRAAQAQQRALDDREAFGTFMAELSRRPDYQEFEKDFMNGLASSGRTPQSVTEDLLRYLRSTGGDQTGLGGDYRGVRNAILRQYQDFQARRARQAQAAPPKPQAPRPPMVESAGGGAQGTRQAVNVNWDAFREAGDDEQARIISRLIGLR